MGRAWRKSSPTQTFVVDNTPMGYKVAAKNAKTRLRCALRSFIGVSSDARPITRCRLPGCQATCHWWALRRLPGFGVEAERKTIMGNQETEQCCSARSEAKKRTCECRYKATKRSEEFQAELQKRLNRAIGQLNGVKSMIDDNRYCGDVLTQLSAAESAVHTVSEMLLRNHLETCVTERVRQGDTEVIDEAMQLIKRFAR